MSSGILDSRFIIQPQTGIIISEKAGFAIWTSGVKEIFQDFGQYKEADVSADVGRPFHVR